MGYEKLLLDFILRIVHLHEAHPQPTPGLWEMYMPPGILATTHMVSAPPRAYHVLPPPSPGICPGSWTHNGIL